MDVGHTDDGTITNWVAESGVLDLFFMLGPKPAQVSLLFDLTVMRTVVAY